MRDAHELLGAAVAALAGPGCVLLAGRQEPWAPATFTGARHVLRLSLPTADADRLAALLPDHDFHLRRHLVADILVTKRDLAGSKATLTIEALTIEAC